MDLAAPETFAFVDQRMARKDEINRIVQDWMSRHSYEEVMALCLEGDVPLGPINTIADIFQDEQFAARGNLLKLQDPQAGEVVVPNVVPRLSRTPGEVRSLGPGLGQHNEEIYGQLGIGPQDLQRLKESKVI